MMKKRILCFVTAAVLILLPWSAPAELCEDGHADPADYYVVGAREPTETEPGYSGDYYCPVCKTLMVHGWKIDPMPPSGGNGQAGQPAIQPPGNDPQDENPDSPVLQPASSEPEPQPDQKQNSNQKQQAGTNPKPAGSPLSKKSGREHFSKDYPFRRVRMNPEPGIRAPAAGELIWPKAVTPMQKMLRGD